MFQVTDRYTGPAGRLRFSHVRAAGRFTGQTTGLAIKYVHRGEEVYQFRDAAVPLVAGHFLLLPAGVAYAAEHRPGRGRTEGVCIDLPLAPVRSPELLFALPFAASDAGLVLPDRWAAAPAIPVDLAACAERISHFATQVDDWNDRLRTEGKKLATRRELLRSLLVARRYLVSHYDQTIALAQLARVAGLSPYHLARLFKRCFGVPPLAWQHELRMQRAAELLRTGAAANLTALALALGYADLAAFSRRFRARYGVPPSRWGHNKLHH